MAEISLGSHDVLETPSTKKHGLFKGDVVRVLTGDLMDLSGTVTDVTSHGKIMVKLEGREELGEAPFDPDAIVKKFDMGDHVCVREGMHHGELGMVIKIEAHRCLILSDLDKSEFWVSAKDLSMTQAVSFGLDKFGLYEVEDLVELQHRQYGIVVFADREFCTVLLAAGSPQKPELKRATLQEIVGKCEARRNATTDVHGNKITAGDIVDFYLEPKRRASGTVKYVSPPYVFAKVQGKTEHLGYVALASKLCAVRGGEHRPSEWGGRGERPRGGRFFLRGRGRGGKSQRDSVMVKVIKGAYRGYRGRIKDETGTHVRVELDAGSRIVTIPKFHVECLDVDQPLGGAGWRYHEEQRPTAAPKTPYGEHHPPTTPYINPGSNPMTSPKYTPARQPMASEPEGPKEDSDSDAEMRFEEGETVTLPPTALQPRGPPQEPSTAPPTEAQSEGEDARLAMAQSKDLIVLTADGAHGIPRDLTDAEACSLEMALLKQNDEERTFSMTGELCSYPKASLKLLQPQKGDWVKVLEGRLVESVGQMVAEDGNDCITRLDDGEIQVFSNDAIAVTLPPSKAS